MGQTRVAVVSTDGTHVNDHFGMAKRFLIYDVDDKIKYVEERPTETLSVGERDHSFDRERFNRISALLNDCNRVYVTKIGDVPAAKLKELGIEPIVFKGAIDQIPR